MGWFADVFGGGKKQQELPMLDLPDYPTLMTGQGAFDLGTTYAQTTMPTAFKSREMALGIQEDPAKAMQFYSGYQPTNFESGIANTYFQDMLEQMNRQALQTSSLQGNEQAYAPNFARAMSPTILGIGQYLGDLGQTRAKNALDYMNIDPMSMVSPYAELATQQDFRQAEGTYNQQLEQVLSNYATQLQNDAIREANKKRSQGALGNLLTSGIGGGILRTQGLGMTGQESTDLNTQIAAMGLSNYLSGGMSSMFPQQKKSNVQPVYPFNSTYSA